MDAQRWRQISQIYHEALARPDEARGAFLNAACGDDEALRSELASMLVDNSRAEAFLGAPVAAALTLLDEAHLKPGSTLGSYRIDRVLGQGGMGTVFLAYDTPPAGCPEGGQPPGHRP